MKSDHFSFSIMDWIVFHKLNLIKKKKKYIKDLTPSTWEYDLIWKQDNADVTN